MPSLFLSRRSRRLNMLALGALALILLNGMLAACSMASAQRLAPEQNVQPDTTIAPQVAVLAKQPTATAPRPTATIQPAPTVQPTPTLSQNLAAYMDQQAAAGKFNGSILIARDGKVLLEKSYGMANFDLSVPNTPQTKFRVGSITKQFTAVSILLLQERGKLNVQDPICKYIKDCPDAWQPITIHQLLTHTSGMPGDSEGMNGIQAFQLYATPRTAEQFMDDLEKEPLDFQPGTKWAYSSTGYKVLGYIVEQVSGQSYEDFLHQNILDPLQLKNTGYDHNQVVLPGRASGYTMYKGNMFNAGYYDMSNPYSGGALYSTVEDLYKWSQALDSGKLISRQTLDAMMTPYMDTKATPPAHYGYGYFLSDEQGHALEWHYGLLPGFVGFIGRYPNDRTTVIFLSNLDSLDSLKLNDGLAGIIFPAQ